MLEKYEHFSALDKDKIGLLEARCRKAEEEVRVMKGQLEAAERLAEDLGVCTSQAMDSLEAELHSFKNQFLCCRSLDMERLKLLDARCERAEASAKVNKLLSSRAKATIIDLRCSMSQSWHCRVIVQAWRLCVFKAQLQVAAGDVKREHEEELQPVGQLQEDVAVKDLAKPPADATREPQSGACPDGCPLVQLGISEKRICSACHLEGSLYWTICQTCSRTLCDDCAMEALLESLSRQQPPPPVEELSLELKKDLMVSFRKIRCLPDGHCMYRSCLLNLGMAAESFALEESGNGIASSEIARMRREVAVYMNQHQAEFPSVEDWPTWLLQTLDVDERVPETSWGDSLRLLALSALRKVIFAVCKDGCRIVFSPQLSAGQFDAPDERTASDHELLGKIAGDEKLPLLPVIWLFYTGGHYDALQRL